MRIECPNCGTAYEVPSARIPKKGAYTQCKKCATRFFVSPPFEPPHDGESDSTEMPQAPASPPATAAPASALDEALADPQLKQCIEQGDDTATAERLLALIGQYVQQKDFATAEGLHTKLYEVAPMAISEAVKAGEMIETGKSDAVDSANLRLWDKLYQRLTIEERNELYFAMRPLQLEHGQVVYRQGDFHSHLYFVQQGRLDLRIADPKTRQTERIKNLTAGDVANITPFFSYTICTATLVAADESRLTYLEKWVLDKWKSEFPGIEANLQNFCEGKGTAVDWAKQAGINIRAFERIQTSQNAAIQLLDPSRQPVQKPFKVVLYDISAGGACFNLKIYQQKEAAKLLQHRLILQAVFPVSGGKQTIKRSGTIVAVHIRPFGETSVHVQFDQAIDGDVISNIKMAA